MTLLSLGAYTPMSNIEWRTGSLILMQSAGCLSGMASHSPEKGPDIADGSHTSSLMCKVLFNKDSTFYFTNEGRQQAGPQRERERTLKRDLY